MLCKHESDKRAHEALFFLIRCSESEKGLAPSSLSFSLSSFFLIHNPLHSALASSVVGQMAVALCWLVHSSESSEMACRLKSVEKGRLAT